VITSEFANVKNRGMMIAAVFAMQGMGILLGGIVTVIVLASMEQAIRGDPSALDVAWRVIISVGIIPALVAVYFRLTIPETPRYTVDVVGDAEQAQKDIQHALQLNSVHNVTSGWQYEDSPASHHWPHPTEEAKKEATFWEHFSQWKYGKVLLGTSYCWFALDIAWYGLALNQSRILKIINYNGSNKGPIYDSFFQKAIGNLIVACMGTVPGYWVTVGLVEVMGRKKIQYMGFFVITIVLGILSVAFQSLVENQVAFIGLFTVANFFFNFGPNQTTFIVPAEVFPTRFRSTAHGMSAAAGKLGAILGIQAVAPFFDSHAPIVMGVFAIVMLSGGLATCLIPETMGKTLEELSGEDEFGPDGSYRHHPSDSSEMAQVAP
jgi:PHS family inorganic phosphate transporter-like MFS transporter